MLTSHRFRTFSSNGRSHLEYGELVPPTLQLARSSRRARILARVLVASLLLSIVGLILVPWQQSIAGKGRVMAYMPQLRQQTIEAPISGRIISWNERIAEGTEVSEGEILLEIQDLDPQLLNRLKEQENALNRKLETARTKAEVYNSQVEAFREAREMAITAADEQVKMSEQKVRAEEKSLEAVHAALHQEKLDYERQKRLAAKGLASGLEEQVAERKYKEAQAKVEQAEAYLESAKRGLASKKAERNQKEREAQTKIDSAQAYLQDTEGEIAMISKELADIQVKVARQEAQVVRAPRDGVIFRMLVAPGSNLVKAGDPLMILVPETADRAVELWVHGNDAPLITPGRHVRLQFEGWPAVQFSGWPSVAVGTFGGQVKTVDATDSGAGRFRVLVTPAEGEEWPSDRYLRQGVRANGWVLLNQVTLGYELWRRMNGFPPAVEKQSDDDSQGFSKAKKVK